MEDSSVSDDLMLISPLFFFLPVSTYTSLWGAPKGTAIFKFLEKETGIETGISEKTLRKYFLGSPKKAPTNSVKAKLERWLHNLGNSGLMKEWIYATENLTARRSGELEWKTLLHSFKAGSAGRVHPKTLDYIEQLLAEETAYFQKAQQQKSHPEQLLKLIYTEPFYLRYGLPISQSLLEKAITNGIEELVSYTSEQIAFIHSYLHGSISFQMDILARAEIEWFMDNLDKISEENHFKSQLSLLLPKIEDNQVISPITSFFHMLRDRLDFSSWSEMAEYMEVKGEADIESKRRKLMGWVKADHIPEHKTAFTFLQRLIVTKGDYSSQYYDDLYLASAFMDGLIKLFLPLAAHKKIQGTSYIQAYSTYDQHFKRHKAAAIKNL